MYNRVNKVDEDEVDQDEDVVVGKEEDSMVPNSKDKSHS